MSMLGRALAAALLTLPVGAYVAGGLVGARAELPDERPPVVIDDEMRVEPAQTLEGRASTPSRPPDDDRDDGPDDDVTEGPEDPDAGDDDVDDGEDGQVPVVRPEPHDLDDDEDDRDEDEPDHDEPDDDEPDDDGSEEVEPEEDDSDDES